MSPASYRAAPPRVGEPYVTGPPRRFQIEGGGYLPGVSDQPCAIDTLLERARKRLDRVHPEQLDDEVARGAVVVDTRPVEQRQRDGALPGAVVVDRNVLEWRLDPSCPFRGDVPVDPDTRVIVVCNEGYSSSLAAASLQDLGLRRATDLVGGYQAWLHLDRLTPR